MKSCALAPSRAAPSRVAPRDCPRRGSPPAASASASASSAGSRQPASPSCAAAHTSALDWSAADPAFAAACRLLVDPYRDLNVYPRPDLVNLQAFGVRFRVLEGAWAGGHEPYFDFRFPGTPKDGEAPATGFYRKDEGGVPFYCRWEGACNSIKRTKAFWMKGSREYFETLASRLPDGARVRWYDGEGGAGQVEFNKAACPHLTQMTAYCNAYERIRVLDQLVRMEPAQVVSVDKDGRAAERAAALAALQGGSPMGGVENGGAYIFAPFPESWRQVGVSLLPTRFRFADTVAYLDAERPDLSSWCRYVNHAEAETRECNLEAMIDTASAHGAEQMVLGMAHRGRLNVLANTLQKPLDHHKRRVRQAAARCANRWHMMAGSAAM